MRQSVAWRAGIEAAPDGKAEFACAACAFMVVTSMRVEPLQHCESHFPATLGARPAVPSKLRLPTRVHALSVVRVCSVVEVVRIVLAIHRLVRFEPNSSATTR